jgi:tetratricopeptide (TPR) repeat protein
LDPEDKVKRCDLLLDLCDALLLAMDLKRLLEVEAPATFSLAEALGDSFRASRACQVASLALYNEQVTLGFPSPQYVEWAERANRYAQPDTIERAFADMALGIIRNIKRHWRSGFKLLDQALELARKLGDPNTLWAVGFALLLYKNSPQRAQENVRLTEELMASLRVGVNAIVAGPVLALAGGAFLVLGKRQRVEELWSELRAMAKRTGQFNLWLTSIAVDAVLTLMDGRLQEVIDVARLIYSRGEEAGVPGYTQRHATFSGYRARIYLGRSLEAFERGFRAYVEQVELSGGRLGFKALLCHVLVLLGRKDEALEILEEGVVRRPDVGTAEDQTAIWLDSLYLEAAVLAGHKRAAELLLNRFSGTGVYTSGYWYNTCIPRHLGGAAALLGRYEEARNHYQEAIRVCTDMRFRPELALTRLQLAELLLEHYPQERADALGHLDFVIPEFRDMKMQPSLERALRHKEILKA